MTMAVMCMLVMMLLVVAEEVVVIVVVPEAAAMVSSFLSTQDPISFPPDLTKASDLHLLHLLFVLLFC